MHLSDDERAVLVYQMLANQQGAARLVRELAEGSVEWKNLKNLVQWCSSKGFWTQADVKSLIEKTIPALNEHAFTQLRGGGQEMRLTPFGRRIHQLWAAQKIPSVNLGGTPPEFYDPEEIDRTGYHPTQRWFLERLAESNGFVDSVPTLLSVPLMNEGVSNVFNNLTIPGWIEEGIVEVKGGGVQIRITAKGRQLLDQIHGSNAA